MYVQLLEIIYSYSYKKTEWEKDSTRRKEKRINRRKKTTRVSKIQKKKSAETKCQYLETDHISTSFIDQLLKLWVFFVVFLFNNYNSSKGKFTKSDRLHGVMPTVAFEI